MIGMYGMFFWKCNVCFLLVACFCVFWFFVGVSCFGVEVFLGDYLCIVEYFFDGGIRFDFCVVVVGGYDVGWWFVGDGDVFWLWEFCFIVGYFWE